MKRLQTLALLVSVLASAPIVAQPMTGPDLSVRDKATIIQLAMEFKLEKEGPLEFSEFVVFSSENMSPALLPTIPGFHFRLMKASQIHRRSQRAETFKYLLIGEFSGHDKFVQFNLGIIERRGGLPYHSHVYQYVFNKVGDKWQGRMTMIIC